MDHSSDEGRTAFDALRAAELAQSPGTLPAPDDLLARLKAAGAPGDVGAAPALTTNARTVLERRYLLRDDAGRVVERPAELFRRVASAVAAAERPYGGERAAREVEERFYGRLVRLEFLPNSPTLMNAGRALGQLAACFVVPVGDSMPEIFDAVKWASLIQMTGGGTGFAFSRLRPAGDLVSSTKGVASGPLSFMDVFNSATDAVKQGGTRRGANMGVLRVDHPDILDFITAKLDLARLRNFNLSVAVTDEFMQAVDRDEELALKNPRSGAVVRKVSARRIFELMATSAWRSGDPGVIFIDRINATHPTPGVGEIESTNPCGEQPLLPFESCVLGSINLACFATNHAVDWPRLKDAIHDGVRFLDDVIDVSRYPLPQIEAITRANRKIGLGVMGFADLLILLGVAYDDDRALAIAEEIAAFLEDESLAASAELARVRGAFPNFAASRWAAGRKDAVPLRNATTTTVAPTGTISIIAGCSSGIEPLFAVSYIRNVLEGERLVEVHPIFRATAERRGFWSDGLAETIAERGRARDCEGVPDDVQRLYPTAHDLAPATHVKMQAVFQRHAHAAVSKTVNFPESATPGDVAEVYRLAYQLGCKGVTVYRDHSRDSQVLSFGKAKENGHAIRGPEEHEDPLGFCPECGGELMGERGCAACRQCGWSRCT
jgi:ribonucleoside-diphosphate reductase alpha chain